MAGQLQLQWPPAGTILRKSRHPSPVQFKGILEKFYVGKSSIP